jgi:hypothetical protein
VVVAVDRKELWSIMRASAKWFLMNEFRYDLFDFFMAWPAWRPLSSVHRPNAAIITYGNGLKLQLFQVKNLGVMLLLYCILSNNILNSRTTGIPFGLYYSF